MRPGDLPPAEHHAHGTRARYVAAKCRCDACRTANRLYARTRAKAKIRGDWNGLVDAGPARLHMHRLRKKNVGHRSIQAAADVSLTVLEEVMSGKKTRIRARTARKILSVDKAAIADHALVPAAATWDRLRWLIDHGYTKTELARRLGSKSAHPALQVERDFVVAKTEQKVRRLYQELVEELKTTPVVTGNICSHCGLSHKKRDRFRYLRRILPNKSEVIRSAFPCLYGGPSHSSGERCLYRDLKEMGAVNDQSVWRLS